MDHFPTMARFNRWVNARLYDSVATLSDEQYRKDVGLFFGSVHATLNHLLLVDILWTRRLRGEPNGFKSLTDIVEDDFTTLRRARVAEDDRFIEQVERMTPADLDRPIVYTRMLGSGQEEVRARHILATLNNHQTHHRGQVHAALTQAGIEPPALDVIYFLEEAGESGAVGFFAKKRG